MSATKIPDQPMVNAGIFYNQKAIGIKGDFMFIQPNSEAFQTYLIIIKFTDNNGLLLPFKNNN